MVARACSLRGRSPDRADKCRGPDRGCLQPQRPARRFLTLTQRELRAPYKWWRDCDNSGLSLALLWRVQAEESADDVDTGYHSGYGGTAKWLTKAKLSELGFDVSHSEESERERRRYERQLPREVLIVLELDGSAYREARERAERHADREEALRAANPDKKKFERRSKEARDRLECEQRQYSRLFVVDAGLDASALRSKYLDRALRYCARGD